MILFLLFYFKNLGVNVWMNEQSLVTQNNFTESRKQVEVVSSSHFNWSLSSAFPGEGLKDQDTFAQIVLMDYIIWWEPSGSSYR